MKNKLIFTLMVMVLIPLTSMAQDIFAKYDGNPDVTYIDIKPKMFQILAKVDVETDSPEAQNFTEMIHSITSLKAIVTGKQTVSADIANWVDSKSKSLEELMEVRDEGTVVKFFVKDGKEVNHVEELLIYVNGIGNQMHDSANNTNGKKRDIETVVVSLTGNIDLSQLNFDLIGDQVQMKESSANILTEDSMIFKELKIYPNPSQDMVTIDLPSEIENDVNITVLNAQGKEIQNHIINTENNTLNVSDLQAGVYLIQIKYDDSRVVKCFVKQ